MGSIRDNYKGVCLAFDKKKLIQNPKLKLKSKIRYLTFEDFEKNLLSIDHNNLDNLGLANHNKSLIDYPERYFLRKHKDYSQENEYRVGLFSEKDYEYISVENCIIGIIVFPGPGFINKYTHNKLMVYSKDMKIPLLYLRLNGDGLRLDIERHCDSLVIDYGYKK